MGGQFDASPGLGAKSLGVGALAVFGAQNTSLRGTGRITLLFFPNSLLFAFV